MGLFDGLVGEVLQGVEGQQGGLGGIVGSLLGGQNLSGELSQLLGGQNSPVLTALLPHVVDAIQQQGGAQNLAASFGSALSDPNTVNAIMSTEQISAIAAKVGITPDEVQQGIATLLPHVTDHLANNA